MMLSSFCPPSDSMFHHYINIFITGLTLHPKRRPTGKELLVKKRFISHFCPLLFFFSSALLQVQPSWFLVNA